MTGIEDIRNPVILFDGVCNLCNSAVQFVMKRDKKNLFKFSSLQSGTGQQLLQKFGLNTTDYSSFLLYADGKIYTKSTAALLVVKNLSGGWSLLYPLIIIPGFIRDFIYNIVAKNRYKWFGKTESCIVPDKNPEMKFFL